MMSGRKKTMPPKKPKIPQGRELDGTFSKGVKQSSKGDFKEGHKRLPGAGTAKGQMNKKTVKFINDMFDVYKKIGHKKFILAHLRQSPALAEKFLDRLTKISVKEIERELQVSLHVTGQIGVDHVHQFGFSPEMVVSAMSELLASKLNPEDLLALPMPVEGEAIDIDVEEVKAPRGTLEVKK